MRCTHPTRFWPALMLVALLANPASLLLAKGKKAKAQDAASPQEEQWEVSTPPS